MYVSAWTKNRVIRACVGGLSFIVRCLIGIFASASLTGDVILAALVVASTRATPARLFGLRCRCIVIFALLVVPKIATPDILTVL